MTMPDERQRSLRNVINFLRDLMDPKKTPRVPRSVIREAYYRLKHFPHDYEINILTKACPEILGELDDGES
jgi:hypothetical protein